MVDHNDQLTPAEIEDFGPDFLRVVAKQAKAATAAETHQIQQSLAEVQNAIRTEQRRQMKQVLDARVPNWRQINDDPGFLQWLQERDAFSGRSRNELLQQAWASNDAQRVANIFSAYRAGGQRPQRQQQRASDWGAPSTGHTRDWPTTGRPIITGAQINAFYNDVIAKKYDHRPEQKAALEKALNDAVREGRVRS